MDNLDNIIIKLHREYKKYDNVINLKDFFAANKTRRNIVIWFESRTLKELLEISYIARKKNDRILFKFNNIFMIPAIKNKFDTN